MISKRQSHRCVAVCAGVEAVLEAVCVLKGVKPIQMEDRRTGQVVEVYWPAAKKMMQDKKFITSLM